MISQRLDANSCGWEQCRKYTPRVKEWGRRPGEEYKLPQRSLHRLQDGTCVSVAFRSIVTKIPGELGGRLGAPWGTRGQAALTAGPPFAPPSPGETSETGLLFLGPLPPPLLVSSRFVGCGQFLLKYWVLPKKKKKDCRLNKNVLIVIIRSLELSYEHVSVLKYC